MNSEIVDTPSGTVIRTAPAWKRALRSRGVWMIVLIAVLGGVLLYWFQASGGAEALRGRFGLWVGVLLIPVMAVVAVSPFPSEFGAMAFGAMYGFWIGSALSWTGWMCAAFLQYFVARRTARDFDFEHAKQRLPRFLRSFPAHHPAFLICARWVPWGPHLVNTAAGVYEVSPVRHGWCAAISLIPYSLFMTAIGAGLISL
jgi:uncharacterized membrane protein YdjX (TVP38/TMEM64 family)